MTAPNRIVQLVQLFDRNRDAYRSGRYNETQVRREFIDPFFKALGWDVDNEQGYAEAYKDVIHEDAIRVAGATKAPDYCFRIGGARKFFLEAKKPSVDIRGSIHPAYQLRRYAWSAKLPLSILTDFEELAVYDCRVRPAKNDPASTARVQYVTYDHYLDRWDELASVFSREAVLKGSFDKYAESTRRKRGTAEVDAAFLGEIEAWRDTLARNLALRNRGLTQRQLNFAVQRTIDRIIFLRICEDRGIESYGRLQALLNGTRVYRRLFELFERADERYNSGIFHFHRERGRAEPPDDLTPSLNIDDKPLQDIIRSLYYPDSPYEFSVLPADILGQVYEQFLGKVIRLTKGHRAVVEDKPEVKKAGGVYYTPTYIVDYIVGQTVGRLLGETPASRNAAVPAAGAAASCRRDGGRDASHDSQQDAGVTKPKTTTPRQVAGLRILDPACGSGSFLLGAYQRLLDWHRDYYTTHDPEKWAKRKNPTIYTAGSRRSASSTPHSALRTPRSDWRLTAAERKRILLNNIYGVDIDPQAVEVTKLSLLLKVLEGETGEALEHQLKLFHERALPDLAANIKCGNSLIGPDFYEGRQMGLFDDDEVYRINAFDWHAEFPHIFKGRNPGFHAVIGNPPYTSYSGRQAVSLSEPQSTYLTKHFETSGWPTSHSLFIERAVTTLSRRFASFIVPDQVAHLSGYGELRTLVTRQGGLVDVKFWGEEVFANVVTPALTFVWDRKHSGATIIHPLEGREAAAVLRAADPWVVRPFPDLMRRIATGCMSLGKLVADPGVHTGNCSKKLILSVGKPTPDAVPVLEGKQISRYYCAAPTKLLRLAYKKRSGEYFTIRQRDKYTSAHFVIRQTAPYPIVGPRRYADYFRNSLLALYSPDDGTDVRYLVGLLNSRLLRFAYAQMVQESRQRAFPQVKVRSLRELPIRPVDLSAKPGRAYHEQMLALVQQMLDLTKRLPAAKTAHRRTLLERQIAATDREIDRLVYELYGLSEAEIAIVEEAIAR